MAIDVCAGFDYGTSQCSIGRIHAGRVELAPLERGATRIASTLYAPRRDWSVDRDGDQILDATAASFADLRFGAAALDAYLADPTEGYFVKSPKSFLGAPGLSEAVKARFVTVVAAMMANVLRRAERAWGLPVRRVVIGRPVNFQGAGDEQGNAQALGMLREAAREAGISEVAFLYEPVAAALEYERRLDAEQRVLVVDVGGGTTDCSLVRVGPERAGRRDRGDDVLGHSGERLGGNDYDQALALRRVMPAFGLGDGLKSGLPFASGYFVDAVTVNDVNAQQRFYARETAERLAVFERDGVQPARIRRLRRLQQGRQSYRLLREVEAAKIALSDAPEHPIDLDFVEPGLALPCARQDLRDASERLLEHLRRLVAEARRQAGVAPDVAYLTGGMARSAVVRGALEDALGGVPMQDSDHFASVTEGLTVWSARLFA